jgi:hypothetical protein
VDSEFTCADVISGKIILFYLQLAISCDYISMRVAYNLRKGVPCESFFSLSACDLISGYHTLIPMFLSSRKDSGKPTNQIV